MGASLAERVRLAVRLCKVRRGRRTAARGVSAPAGGLSSGDAPPIFFSILWKRKRAVHGPKRKALGALRCSGPPRARGSAYRCLLRFCLAFGHAWVFCEVDTAVPWRGFRPRRGARTHLICSSFTVSRCGAPSISVTSVPLVPPSARSACPQGARRIRKRQSRQRLRSRYALPRRA